MLRVAFKSNFQHFLCTIVLLKRFKVAYNKRIKFKKIKEKVTSTTNTCNLPI